MLTVGAQANGNIDQPTLYGAISCAIKMNLFSFMARGDGESMSVEELSKLSGADSTLLSMFLIVDSVSLEPFLVMDAE